MSPHLTNMASVRMSGTVETLAQISGVFNHSVLLDLRKTWNFC